MLLMTDIDFFRLFCGQRQFLGRALILYAGIELCWLDDDTLALCTSI